MGYVGNMPIRSLCILVLGALACGPVVAPPGVSGEDGNGDDTGSTATGGPSSTTDEVPPNPTTVGSTVTTQGPGEDTQGETASSNAFVSFIDDGTDTVCFTHCSDCDVWAQDCPEGEKCMPWANDGGNAWNATRCSPIEASPDAIGQPCTVEGSGVSGIDSCELGAMCFEVDPATNTGVCVGFCAGTRADPGCATACDACHISNDGVLTLCRPICHPGQDDCGPGRSCIDIDGAFECSTYAGDAALGEPCDSDLSCQAGLACAPADALSDCAGEACCTPWCDTNAVDPCGALVAGTSCQLVPELGDGVCNPGIGRCVLPPP